MTDRQILYRLNKAQETIRDLEVACVTTGYLDDAQTLKGACDVVKRHVKAFENDRRTAVA